MRHKLIIAITIITIITFSLFAVEIAAAQQKSSRPKIGLTLGGGGAKGLAHIGILQAIDSAGLRIDYITGTSMGSIVGAMYAAGYCGDAIEQIANTLDWNLLFSTSPRLSAISIEEKQEYQNYALEIPFIHGKFKIGKGIIEGQELWIKFNELFEPVYNIQDFNKLSIPFACIGTDLETGNAVVMNKGNIVTAIRASMAIPSIFTPVKYDEKLLVDGGVVNNFPVTVAKKMGADYVIGVNLNTGLSKADKLESALDILLQIGFFKDAQEFEKQKKACDLYIFPDMKDYSTGSFNSSDSIIAIGKETGKIYFPYFKKLADSLEAIYGKSNFVKNRLPELKKINISNYSVDGLKNTSEKFFLGLLNLKNNYDYSNKQMADAIRRVYGSRYYKMIRYDYQSGVDGKTEMRFHAEENPLTAIKTAINYNDFTKLGLKLNITSRDFLLNESRALISVQVSENPRVYLEYYKFINKNRSTRLNGNFYSEEVDFPVYSDFELYQTLRSKYRSFDLQVQHNLGLYSYIGIGQQFTVSNIKTTGSPELIYNGQNDYWYSYSSFVFNNTNEKYFPTTGWNVNAQAGYVYSQDPDFSYSYDNQNINSDTLGNNYNDYIRLNIKATHVAELQKKLALISNMSLSYIILKDPYIANNFLVGGVNDIIRNQVTFVGLNESEIKTGSIASAQIGLQYQLVNKVFITGRANIGMYDFHATGLKNITAKNNFLSGYGLTFGYNSLIGPIELTLMYSDQDKQLKTSINLGYSF